jgi:alkyl hydroperoxide reductase subunit AhpC
MKINDVVENFTLQNQDGKTVNLTDFKNSPVVLFFYPRADTPGCTIESCGFRDAFEKFQKQGIVVLGISRDTVKDQKKFKDKYSLPGQRQRPAPAPHLRRSEARRPRRRGSRAPQRTPRQLAESSRK